MMITSMVFVVAVLSQAHAACPSPRTAQAVLDCAVNSAPEVREAEARNAAALAGEGAAKQRPNPEVDAKGVWGGGRSRMELDLLHTVEVGGKRAARRELAAAERQAAGAASYLAKGETAVRSVAALYRLRQIDAENAIIGEALETFSRIRGQLKSRPRLAPEQAVARSIFELAEGDYKLKKAALMAEKEGLRLDLEVAIGGALSVEELPRRKADWPVLEERQTSESPEAAQGQAVLSAGRAGTRSAEAASWPDVKLGPSLERETAGSVRQNALGLNLTLPLPLYHRNASGRQQARRTEEAARIESEVRLARLQAERRAAVARYKAAVAALQDVSVPSELERKHEGVEDFFQRGLIPSSLVIEAHRQIYEFTRDWHEQELTAIRALWRVRAIDGRMGEERL